MPTEEENIKFLYLILTISETPAIDFDKVAADLKLNKGAATKRWSRLQKAMKDGTNPGPSANELLWLCMKHAEPAKSINWRVIADACGCKPGAASKRFFRLKQARAASDSATTKRKRGDDATANDMDAMTSPRQENDENGHDEDNEPAQPTPKKRKAPAAKAKSATKPRADGATKATKGRKAPVTKVPVDGEVVDENDEQGQLDTIKQEYTNDTVAKMDESGSMASKTEPEYDPYSVYGLATSYNGNVEHEHPRFEKLI